ncbi:MAG: hypothetical protein RLZZ499_2896, partial [Cyanobacteriota bacterium]
KIVDKGQKKIKLNSMVMRSLTAKIYGDFNNKIIG